MTRCEQCIYLGSCDPLRCAKDKERELQKMVRNLESADPPVPTPALAGAKASLWRARHRRESLENRG